MMTILLIFSLSLISVPVGCAVTGYSGGSVIIHSNFQWDSGSSGYLCKKETAFCAVLIDSNNTENVVQVERFLLFNTPERCMSVLIRRLKPQDAGRYIMGVVNGISTDVILTIVNDSCCAEPETVSAFPGQNINIIFNYPGENKKHSKYIVKLDSYSVFNPILDTYKKLRRRRFSASEDRRAQVLSMNISNVRKDDAGVYLCGVYNKYNSVLYLSFFSEIQLRVKGEAPAEISFDIVQSTGSSVSSIIIISVCVCVTLLLIGVFALLIYKLRHRRTQGLRPSSQGTEQASSVYENELPNLPPYENLNVRMTSNYQNLDSSRSQPVSTYQTLDPFTNQADSGYMSLTTTTGQYQSLNPQTRANSVYHTLQS